jgi:hypothetical protein
MSRNLTPKDVEDVAASLTIVRDYPPNIKDIAKVFPMIYRDALRGIYFSYDNKIYNPSGHVIEVQLFAHEAVHALQQKTFTPQSWWEYYLASPKFRLEQETEAHRVEWLKYNSMGYPRAFRRRYLTVCAERLAGPLYGNLCKKREARAWILGETA